MFKIKFFFLAKPITKNPNVGEVFCIRSPNDGSFNRGLVEEKINENEYKVIFVDSGIKDIVPVSNFIEIPKNLKQVNFFLVSGNVLIT